MMRSFFKQSFLIMRSILGQALFYTNITLWLIAIFPLLFLPKSWGIAIVKSWGTFSRLLLKYSAGLDFQIDGLENLPKGGYLVAAKHQSSWETFALLPIFPDPVFILKRELLNVPLFGWYALKLDMIPVERRKKNNKNDKKRKNNHVMMAMITKAKEALDKGRQVIIFPEGTRAAINEKPHYKKGIQHLYTECLKPCVPIALNAGLFWPRRSFLLYPGTIRVKILPPIAPGLEGDVFFEKLQHVLETESSLLVENNIKEAFSLPLLHDQTMRKRKK